MNINRELDNSAKIFPLVIGKQYNGTFRISAVLKEKIDKDLLKEAVEITLEEIKCFKVKIEKGFFWYCFKENNNSIIVEETKEFGNKIDFKQNNDYLFKVSYKENEINIDIFHSLCDGIAGIKFFKKIIYNYLDLKIGEIDINEDTEQYVANDSYTELYKKENTKNKLKIEGKVYKIKGHKTDANNVETCRYLLDLNKLKEKAREKNATITEYLSAILIYAIRETNYKKHNGNKPIKICIPVNLRKYFNSNTMSNYFSHINVESNKENFDEILEDMKKQFTTKLEKQNIKETINKLIALGTNPIIGLIPLKIKRIIVRAIYWKITNFSTTIISNIGKIDISDKYKESIKSFAVSIEPDPSENIKCSMCSYENILTFTFASTIKEKEIQEKFCELIRNEHIQILMQKDEFEIYYLKGINKSIFKKPAYGR